MAQRTTQNRGIATGLLEPEHRAARSWVVELRRGDLSACRSVGDDGIDVAIWLIRGCRDTAWSQIVTAAGYSASPGIIRINSGCSEGLSSVWGAPMGGTG